MAKALKNTLPVLLLLIVTALAICPATAMAGELTDWIDSTVPTGLTLLGFVLGCPALIIAGRLWGRVKPARLVENLVTSIQFARKGLATGNKDALNAVDTAMKRAMSEGTRKAVNVVKHKLKLPSARRR